MYFASVGHRKNYMLLMNLYKLKKNQDVEYEANIYIAAYPDIFKCFILEKLDLSFGPLTVFLGEKEFHNTGALTGTTIRMINLGMSLYNGHEIGLNEIIGSINNDEVFNVCIEAIRIRTGKCE